MILRVGLEMGEVEIVPSDFLRALRAYLGLTRAEFAKQLDIAPITIRKIEEGENAGSQTTWNHIAQSAGTESLKDVNLLVGAATKILLEIEEDLDLQDDDLLRLYYLISPVGKLFAYDYNHLDKDISEGFYIRAPLSKVRAFLTNQKRELGS